jgi:3-hydroxy-9,10-secoandrosta-1,3,5(10)-triene-9,17-dione monooxygenase reductase component
VIRADAPQLRARPLDGRSFRDVCGMFATGVTVVAADGGDGPRGATVNAFTSLSVEPPRVIVCLAATSRTWRAVEAVGHFTVNVLAAEQEELARHFASGDAAKGGAVAWRPAGNGAPALPGAAAVLECTLVSASVQSTHRLLIADVTGADHRPEADPLLFYRGRLYDSFGSAVR